MYVAYFNAQTKQIIANGISIAAWVPLGLVRFERSAASKADLATSFKAL